MSCGTLAGLSPETKAARVEVPAISLWQLTRRPALAKHGGGDSLRGRDRGRPWCRTVAGGPAGPPVLSGGRWVGRRRFCPRPLPRRGGDEPQPTAFRSSVGL